MFRTYLTLTLFALVVGFPFAAPAQTSTPEAPPLTQTNASRMVVLRLLEEVWNKGHVELCDELLAPSAVVHIDGRDYPAGPDESKRVVAYWRSALTGFRFQIGEVVAEGDRVVAHVPFEGVQIKPILDLPATGRKVRLDETLICRVEHGKIAEIWESFDESGLRRQLTADETTQSAER
jgi:predicted ester cyclase